MSNYSCIAVMVVQAINCIYVCDSRKRFVAILTPERLRQQHINFMFSLNLCIESTCCYNHVHAIQHFFYGNDFGKSSC